MTCHNISNLFDGWLHPFLIGFSQILSISLLLTKGTSIILHTKSTRNQTEFSSYHEVIVRVLWKFSFINKKKMSQCIIWELKKCINLCIASLWRQWSFISLEALLNILFSNLLDFILVERFTNHFPRFTTCNENSELFSLIATTRPGRRLWITCWFSLENIYNIVAFSVISILYFKFQNLYWRDDEVRIWNVNTSLFLILLFIICQLTRPRKWFLYISRWCVEEN